MFQVVVSRGVNGNRLDAHFFAGSENPQGNFTTIGNYNFVEHIFSARLVSAALVDDEQDLSVLDRVAVLYANGFDRA